MAADRWARRASGLLVPRLGFANENDQPYPCDECCIEEEEGVVCEQCDGSAPSEWAVTFADISNDTCENCVNLNDTFIVTFRNLFPNGCRWGFIVDPDVCTAEDIVLNVQFSGGQYKMFVDILIPDILGLQIAAQFLKNFGSDKPVCSELIDEGISDGLGGAWILDPPGGDDNCDILSPRATCTVTAL